MFRAGRYARPSVPCFGESFHEAVKTEDSGLCVIESVSDCGKLPDCANFELDKMLKAGLPLEKVSTAILNGSYAKDFANDLLKQSVENPDSVLNNNEVNNEK